MYCRLCLFQARILIPMRDEAGNISTDILGAVHKYTGLSSEDCICVSCWSSVDNFRKFCLLVAERQEQYAWSKEVAEQEEAYENAKELTTFARGARNSLESINVEENCCNKSRASGTQQNNMDEDTNNTIMEDTAPEKSLEYANVCNDNIISEEKPNKEIYSREIPPDPACGNKTTACITQQGNIMCEGTNQQNVEVCNSSPEKSLEYVNVFKDSISTIEEQHRRISVGEVPQQPACNVPADKCITVMALSGAAGGNTSLKDTDMLQLQDECAMDTLVRIEKLDTTPNKMQTVVQPSVKEVPVDNLEIVYTKLSASARKLGRPRRSDAPNQAAEDQLIASYVQLVCDVCKFEPDCFKALKDHFKSEHNSNGYVVCCQKRLYKRGILVDHINVHRNPAYFSCKSCATNFADRLCLRNHLLLKHQQATESPHECTICGARFAKERFLQQHARKHATAAEGAEAAVQQQCTLCGKSYPNAIRLQAHTKHVHDSGSLNVCTHCGVAVSGKQCYARHLAQHGAQSESGGASTQRSVQCSVCGQWLAHKSSLRLHMQRHEDVKSSYACELCGKEAATRVAINAHKRLCHASAQRQHACNVCARTFGTTRRLREHMTTHTGEHLYRCNYCDKRFKCSSNLHAHRKWKHPAEWTRDQDVKMAEEFK